MSADLAITSGDVRVRVTGIKQLALKMRKAGADLTQMNTIMHTLGEIVVHAAVPLTPYRTGRLAGTVRAGAGRTKAVIRAGGAATPYAGVIHYGWPARNIEPQPYLTDARGRTRPTVLAEFDRAVSQLIKQNNL